VPQEIDQGFIERAGLPRVQARLQARP